MAGAPVAARPAHACRRQCYGTPSQCLAVFLATSLAFGLLSCASARHLTGRAGDDFQVVYSQDASSGFPTGAASAAGGGVAAAHLERLHEALGPQHIHLMQARSNDQTTSVASIHDAQNPAAAAPVPAVAVSGPSPAAAASAAVEAAFGTSPLLYPQQQPTTNATTSAASLRTLTVSALASRVWAWLEGVMDALVLAARLALSDLPGGAGYVQDSAASLGLGPGQGARGAQHGLSRPQEGPHAAEAATLAQAAAKPGSSSGLAGPAAALHGTQASSAAARIRPFSVPSPVPAPARGPAGRAPQQHAHSLADSSEPLALEDCMHAAPSKIMVQDRPLASKPNVRVPVLLQEGRALPVAMQSGLDAGAAGVVSALWQLLTTASSHGRGDHGGGQQPCMHRGSGHGHEGDVNAPEVSGVATDRSHIRAGTGVPARTPLPAPVHAPAEAHTAGPTMADPVDATWPLAGAVVAGATVPALAGQAAAQAAAGDAGLARVGETSVYEYDYGDDSILGALGSWDEAIMGDGAGGALPHEDPYYYLDTDQAGPYPYAYPDYSIVPADTPYEYEEPEDVEADEGNEISSHADLMSVADEQQQQQQQQRAADGGSMGTSSSGSGSAGGAWREDMAQHAVWGRPGSGPLALGAAKSITASYAQPDDAWDEATAIGALQHRYQQPRPLHQPAGLEHGKEQQPVADGHGPGSGTDEAYNRQYRRYSMDQYLSPQARLYPFYPYDSAAAAAAAATKQAAPWTTAAAPAAIRPASDSLTSSGSGLPADALHAGLGASAALLRVGAEAAGALGLGQGASPSSGRPIKQAISSADISTGVDMQASQLHSSSSTGLSSGVGPAGRWPGLHWPADALSTAEALIGSWPPPAPTST